ncbi:hypothetical protein SCLCIDRAFT_133318, partial [Scleroderma citrinum Foug A]
LRKVAFKIVHSTTIVLLAWKDILNDLCLMISLMPRDIATRWNSTFDLLEYALKHRKAVDLLTQRRELGLGKFELSITSGQLLNNSAVLKDATLFFSCSTPNLATVIPAMDHINQELTTYLRDRKYLVSIRSGVSLAKQMLNHYYGHTDTSEVYQIAMGKQFIGFFIPL